MEWRDISTCPKHTKAVFGYLDQFGRWVFETFENSKMPVQYGYTYWLEIKPPVFVQGAR